MPMRPVIISLLVSIGVVVIYDALPGDVEPRAQQASSAEPVESGAPAQTGSSVEAVPRPTSAAARASASRTPAVGEMARRIESLERRIETLEGELRDLSACGECARRAE